MKLPTLESVKNIDLKDTKTITIIIIVVIILFAILYIWQNKKNTEEGFAQYNVNEGDTVVLPDLNSVIVDSINNERNKSLLDAFNIVIDDRLNTSSTLNTYAKASDLLDTNNIISSNIALMTGLVNNASPPLTVVAYFGSTAPTGWQLCDGMPLIAMDGNNVVYSIGNSFNPLNTPNLLGRFILGATSSLNADIRISTGIVLRNNIGITGGEENHTLTINEMPSHSHEIPLCCGAPGDPNGSGIPPHRLNTGIISSPAGWWPTGSTGGNLPHNNMPPYYTLAYIIKKPLRGGNANAVQQPSPAFT